MATKDIGMKKTPGLTGVTVNAMASIERGQEGSLGLTGMNLDQCSDKELVSFEETGKLILTYN